MTSEKLAMRTYPLPENLIDRLDKIHEAHAKKHEQDGLRCPKRTTLATILALGCEALEGQLSLKMANAKAKATK